MKTRLKKKKGLSKIQDKELWGLDVTIAKFVLPRLIKFKQKLGSYPSNLKDSQEWEGIIDKMIWSFEYVIKDDSYCLKYSEEDWKRYKEGMDLFAEYFRDLWD